MLKSGKNRNEFVGKNVSIPKYSLPPNVKGQCRGRLSLCLHEIDWLSDDGPSNFDTIQTKAIWWGDKVHSSATLKLRNKPIRVPTLKIDNEHTTNVIHYKILTKLKLFKNYLASSGGVELRFTSATSNISIGTAIVPIPMQLINFIDIHQTESESMKMQKFRSKCQINNSHNKKTIGTITIDYDMLLCDRPIDERELNCEIISNGNGKDHRNENDANGINVAKKKTTMAYPKDEKGETAKSIVQMPKSVKMLSSKNCDNPHPLMDYLTGRTLTDHETDRAIKAMETISPSQSLIDFLTIDLDCLSLQRPQKTHRSFELSSLDQIDSMRTHIYELTLTRAGVREILNDGNCSYSSGSFVVDVNLDSKASTDIESTFVSEVSHIFSSMSDCLPPPVNFDKYSIQKLNNVESSLVESVSLTFWYRDIVSNRSRYFGLAKIRLADILQGTDFTYKCQCPIRTSSGGVIVGAAMIKIELGCRALHFGTEYIDAISMAKSIHELPFNFETVTQSAAASHEPCSYYNENGRDKFLHRQLQMDGLMFRSCVHDEHTDRNGGNASTMPDSNTPPSNQSQQHNRQQPMHNRLGISSNSNHSHASMGSNDSARISDDTLQGLFYVGQCSSLRPMGETLLICRPFWSNDVLVTESYRSRREDNCYLNYLEMFSVLSNDQLNKATKHNFMNIELWQRQNNQMNTMIGIAKVSLHQFFIAFNNAHIRNHVTKQKIPVISIDGWVTFSSMQATSDTPIGTVQVILAVGTCEQIAKFKISKSLTPCKIFSKMSPETFPLEAPHIVNHRPAPNMVNHRPIQVPQNEPNPPAPLRLPLPPPSPPLAPPKSPQSQLSDDHRQANLAAMLSNFIENLALKLPERNAGPNESRFATTSSSSTTTLNTTNNGLKTDADTAISDKQLRPTSELLDELHRALCIAPTPAQRNSFQCKVNEEEPSIATVPIAIKTGEQQIETTISNAVRTMFRIHIEIECALHLPPDPKQGIEPTTYVSFEAFAPNANDEITMPNSIVYTTDVIESSSSPQWNNQYEVSLPVDFLTDDQKRFTLHIWRKCSSIDSPSVPNLIDDAIIGDASIDLSVLVACLPSIDGWFNIIHISGSINGQIKVQIKPNATDLAPYISEHNASQMDHIQENSPINVFLKDFDDSALSRALKRKFGELEEITQRLRARLFDVTGDSDDQFETDLNTIPDES